MRILTLCVLVAALALAVSSAVQAQKLDREQLVEVSKQFQRFTVIEDPGKPLRYVYADAGNVVHVYEVKDGYSELKWETTNLGARPSGLIVKDLNGDGRQSLVISTLHGRILIYDTDRFNLEWENLQDRFGRVHSITAENIDQDPQDELIFIANEEGRDPHLRVYDSVIKSIEWRSPESFEAQQILVANTDDDPQLEIVLNTGFVIDSRFYNIEWAAKTRFGERIALLDLTGDELPEVVGVGPDFVLRVFDIYAEREIW